MSLFIAVYFDHLMRGSLPQGRLYRWLSLLFFTVLGIGSLGLPVLAWLWHRDALGLSLPFAAIMALGALAGALSAWRGFPSLIFSSTAVTLLLGWLYAALWITPYVDAYKSPRGFAHRVKELVGASEPLYIYADTMNDFNFYIERDVIPVLASKGEVENLLLQEVGVYLLIRERDFKRLNIGVRFRPVLEARVGDKEWRLIRIGS